MSLPPLITDTANEELHVKLKHYITLKDQSGCDLTENIRRHKDFANPQILQKTADYFCISQISSNYPTEIYDPHSYLLFDFEDHIRKRYSSIPSSTGSTGIIKDDTLSEVKKRQSKWGPASTVNNI